ncbi:hypothetical protein RF11_03178 [Thelohanellus kitauei]|uniref:Uncharacterized protein n=1 Tax=Thelohanellus kitauei TaxID=669202 RepID=A0A0C2MZJ0_THEKT|nr:hypothetical protein RF11_03178 [Thelohanellus kitauei]
MANIFLMLKESRCHPLVSSDEERYRLSSVKNSRKCLPLDVRKIIIKLFKEKETMKHFQAYSENWSKYWEKETSIVMDNIRFHHTTVNNMIDFPKNKISFPGMVRFDIHAKKHSAHLKTNQGDMECHMEQSNKSKEHILVKTVMVNSAGVKMSYTHLVRRMTDFYQRIPVIRPSNSVANSNNFSSKCLNLEDIPRD